MNNKVYIIRCENYSDAPQKMNELINKMGGIEQFAKGGERITLKANLLGAALPEQAVSTHPAIVAAIGKMAKQQGAIPLIADSPGSGYRYTEATLKKLYTSCGMYDAAKEAGIDVNMDTSYSEVSYPEGKLIKHIEVIAPITNADGVFNLCKMKTHAFMHMTGAVKNNFGIIPGLSKVGYHAKLQDKNLFADMMLDLALFVSPRLSIMDAVLAMEGDGPGVAGTPRHVGLLLASTNPLALDIAAAEIMGLPHKKNPLLLAAERRGLLHRIEDIEIIGEELSSIKISDYVFPATITEGTGLAMSPLAKMPAFAILARSLLAKMPFILKKDCVGCGVCRDSCPQKAITITQKKPHIAVINKKNCIRCYCCHELCPKKAVDIRSHPIAKLLKV
jgi:uncharacterized protein (DUF362 family)/Pyruvate/2-oxoacid:ferredoxin oxidoreductase delta subunit